MTHKSALLAAGLLLLSASVWAGEADVLDASIDPDGRGTYRVTVTVRHADTGWDHYADGWEVVAPEDRRHLCSRKAAGPLPTSCT